MSMARETRNRQHLPTLYQYYTAEGIKSGLSDSQPFFTLNGKRIVLYSGALHYFRVVPEYWRDRLRKYRAAGLNAVETYVPWNLHEPEEGFFDFGNGGTDYEKFLDIRKFLRIAQEEDLFVILRPGPYICAEWEFGGMPSWLLKYKSIKLRTSDELFVMKFKNYFKELFRIVVPLQFTKGGPVIAFQIENEYGNTKNTDESYLKSIKDTYLECGVTELLFTSDTPSNGFTGTLKGVLATANFDASFDVQKELSLLREFQPNKPLMVMEYWSGWFDHWTEDHQTRSSAEVCKAYEEIIKSGCSVNIYMFHGGSNWGFMNGGNFLNDRDDNSGYIPTISSYDYDAPLSESGEYTQKYFGIKEIINKYNDVKTLLPPLPEVTTRIDYPAIRVTGKMNLNQMISQIPNHSEETLPIAMEMLHTNNNNGQSYGYMIYRKTNLSIPSNSKITIEGHVCDSVLILINGILKNKIIKSKEDLSGFGYWQLENSFLELGIDEYENATLDLVVENWGRANYGKLSQFNQHKGIWQGNVLLNDAVLENWQIYPLEFKSKWSKNLEGWTEPNLTEGPALYRGVLNISKPVDTFIDMRLWIKGIIIVNGFVLSRYLQLGPQQTAFLPGPLLRKGENELLIFEHFYPSEIIGFCSDPIFKTL